MTDHWYVAEDGTIHRRTVSPGREPPSPAPAGLAQTNPAPQRRRMPEPAPQGRRTPEPTPLAQASPRVSAGRKLAFWVITILAAVLGSLAAQALFGSTSLIGAVAGSFLYGIFQAEKEDYNLGACFHSALWAAAGILALTAGLAAAAAIGAFLLRIFLAILAICVVLAMFGGS